MRTFEINKLVRHNVAAMTPYSSARDEFKDAKGDMIFLDANENPFENGANRYPDPQQRDLKELIAVQRGLATSNVLLGNGSDEVLDLLFRAFCVPGKDAVIINPPTYGMYKVLAQTNDISIKEVLLDTNFQIQPEVILEAVDAYTKLIFICSPNNPTGNLIAKDRIQQLLDNFDGLVIVDEAYIDFCISDSLVKKLRDNPNLVITQTLSKAYGLAGIRLGICCASEAIVSILNKIKPPYNVNSLTQSRAHERVSQIAKIHLEVDTIKDERAILHQQLEKLSFVSEVFPSMANFILARVDDAGLRYEQLIKQGIVVRNRSSQALCENTLRFTVGTRKENVQLITALKNLAK